VDKFLDHPDIQKAMDLISRQKCLTHELEVLLELTQSSSLIDPHPILIILPQSSSLVLLNLPCSPQSRSSTLNYHHPLSSINHPPSIIHPSIILSYPLILSSPPSIVLLNHNPPTSILLLIQPQSSSLNHVPSSFPILSSTLNQQSLSLNHPDNLSTT
jgi:hypothetical protein